MGADFLVCSAYKFFGPHCGSLVADPALLETLRPDKLLPSTDVVPERFELGTLPYELLAGVTAAIDLIASVGSGGTRREQLVDAAARIAEHELRLRTRIEEGLVSLGDRLTLHSRAAERTSTLFLTLRDRSPLDVFEHLAKRDVLVPGRHVLRPRDLPRPRPLRRLRAPDRAGRLQRRLGRRPAARGAGGGSRLTPTRVRVAASTEPTSALAAFQRSGTVPDDEARKRVARCER